MNQQQRNLAEGILFTDMYQFTMAQLYFRAGLHEQIGQYDHYFRNYPNYGEHQAGYCINAGMGWLLGWMREAHFTDDDIQCLRHQTNPDGSPTFAEDFLQYLRKHGNFDGIKMLAIAEGRVVHPGVPLTVVEGPLGMAQILETPLLNTLNFQTLIATKAARIRHIVGPNMLMEFGLRRAHGLGGNQGARAALIGGCDFTSNTGLSCVMGLPPKGTHSHAMMQTYLALGKTEYDAFKAYADLYPDSCLLLVDTIDTLGSGLPNAIKVFEELRRSGHKPLGIRIDSGDLAYLAIQASKMLDEAGFPETCIVLSNDLDELTIWQIHSQIRDEAANSGVDAKALIKRLSYGVGTRLITSSGQSALGGVYKMVALKQEDEWLPAIKLSNTMSKTPNPGHKRAWRIYDKRSRATADLVGLDSDDFTRSPRLTLHHPSEAGITRTLSHRNISRIEPLLELVWEGGHPVQEPNTLDQLRENCQRDLATLDSGVCRLRNPHIYHVSLSTQLLKLKTELIAKMRKQIHDIGEEHNGSN